MVKKREGYTVIFSDLAKQRIKDSCCPTCGKHKSQWKRRKDWRCCSTDCTKRFWKEQVKVSSWLDLRKKCFERDDWKCVKCGKQPTLVNTLIADHIKAIAIGGDEWDINNIQTLCPECHKIKTAIDAKKISKLREIEKKQTNGQMLIPFDEKQELGNEIPFSSKDVGHLSFCLKNGINKDNLKLFFYFINERQNIWFNRFILNKSKPWTSDLILQKYKFTNVYRILDRGTQYVLNNIIGKGIPKEVFFNIIIYRIFNKEETFEQIGFQKLDFFNNEKIYEILNNYRSKGNAIWTNAFMVTGFKFKNSNDKLVNYLWIIKQIFKQLDTIYLRCTNSSMEDCHRILSSLRGISLFLSYQIMLDAMYGKVLSFDEDEWTVAGTGAERGIRYIFDKNWTNLEAMRYLFDNQKLYFRKYKMEFKYLHNIENFKHLTNKNYISLSNIENCCCEFSKYMKAFNNSGRPRINFVPRKGRFY